MAKSGSIHPATARFSPNIVSPANACQFSCIPATRKRARGEAAGKEECWFILEAELGSTLGIGTVRPLGAAKLRAAALSGAIEDLMESHALTAAMFFHIPPGTVHAIGGGISLIEIQQKSDVTYRLYGYGRPRELHLGDGTAVARAVPMLPSLQTAIPRQSTVLLSGACC
ncbi:class I mannose-6-phosphate isomerase [Sphingopyxis sp.]|uniref:class I mannose-6-phosphate isomerase n=1 Tax=Sphingopyxis sp. TaxID=1908224 RepID=UPI0025D7D12A|nr:class I mannose-6-phosphate isomerase [Sphingopyxis sp.]